MQKGYYEIGWIKVLDHTSWPLKEAMTNDSFNKKISIFKCICLVCSCVCQQFLEIKKGEFPENWKLFDSASVHLELLFTIKVRLWASDLEMKNIKASVELLNFAPSQQMSLPLFPNWFLMTPQNKALIGKMMTFQLRMHSEVLTTAYETPKKYFPLRSLWFICYFLCISTPLLLFLHLQETHQVHGRLRHLHSLFPCLPDT